MRWIVVGLTTSVSIFGTQVLLGLACRPAHFLSALSFTADFCSATYATPAAPSLRRLQIEIGFPGSSCEDRPLLLARVPDFC